MKQPLVSIILVTYNPQKYIRNCIDSVLDINYESYEIIVVDNNSTDNTRQILEKYKTKIQTIYNDQNLGYAEANNLGAGKAKGKYLFILNPDTLVNKNFLKPLVNEMEDDNTVAACQPLVYLLNDKEKINLTGKETHFLGFDWIRDYLKKIPSRGGEIASFSGSGVLIRHSIFDKLRGFDPLYFMYYEDSDLSWRMRLFGYKIIFVPVSTIYHDYKYIPDENYQSLKGKLFYNERNRLINLIKNYKLSTLIILSPAILFLELCLLLYATYKGWLKEKISGYLSIIKNFGYIVGERKVIQKGRKVGDKQIILEFKSTLDFIYFRNIIVTLIINPLLSLYWFTVRRFL